MLPRRFYFDNALDDLFEEEEKDEKKKYLRRERVYGKYSRSFYLGDVDEENIEASYNNGTLHIAVPKIDENKNRKLIDIK